MTSQMPKLPMAGAIDLAALASARKAEAEVQERAKERAATGAPSAVFDATDATFQPEVLQRSMTNPVVVDLWATWCHPCKTLSPILERVTDSYEGAVYLAKVDVDANPGLAQAFQVQSIPAVFVVLAGQVMPLFQGAVPEPQVRQVFEQVLTIARQQGMPCPTFAQAGEPGAVDDGEWDSGDGVPEGEGEGDDADDGLDDIFTRAVEAIDAGDWDAATAAYKEALTADPLDADAKAGLLLVDLMRRGASADAEAMLAHAMNAPADVEAQISAADALAVNGRYDEAFAVLIAAVKVFSGKERDRARTRLLELFSVAGEADPSVAAARKALAAALF
ncbi:MAG: tetratricopeptide repeat protein [Actinomycetales bacterium]|nr:tetratricopeptide repeat protein [Actinomycetales bacterium]